MRMRAWRETIGEIFRKKQDTLISIVGLVLAFIFVPIVWLKILLSVFVAYSLFKIWEGVHVLQKEKHVPLAVVVFGHQGERDSFVDDCLSQMDRWHFDEATFSGLGVDRDDWLISRPGDLPADPSQWASLVQEFADRIYHIRAKLKGPEFLHVFLKCRTALVFGLGAKTGTWNNVTIHQEAPGEFKPVIYLDGKVELTDHHDPHTMKSRVEPPYKFIEATIPDKLSTPTLVSLHLSAHSPRPSVEEEARRRGLSCVLIENTYNNTLTTKDWFHPAQETASVLLQLLEHSRELEIYQNCPNAIAFAIGMALGDQCTATIFHWFPKENAYKPVLKLNELG